MRASQRQRGRQMQMSDLITNFVNGWAMHMPGNPFVALALLLFVGTASLIRLIWSLKRMRRDRT